MNRFSESNGVTFGHYLFTRKKIEYKLERVIFRMQSIKKFRKSLQYTPLTRLKQ
jgi:hypothetical protein